MASEDSSEIAMAAVARAEMVEAAEAAVTGKLSSRFLAGLPPAPSAAAPAAPAASKAYAAPAAAAASKETALLSTDPCTLRLTVLGATSHGALDDEAGDDESVDAGSMAGGDATWRAHAGDAAARSEEEVALGFLSARDASAFAATLHMLRADCPVEGRGFGLGEGSSETRRHLTDLTVRRVDVLEAISDALMGAAAAVESIYVCAVPTPQAYPPGLSPGPWTSAAGRTLHER